MGQATPINNPAGANPPGASAQKSALDDASDTAQRLADKAREMAGAAADAVGSQASELADNARDYAARGRDAFIDKVEEQKGVGADYVSGVAQMLRRVAGEFDQQAPFAAGYIRTAAAQADNVADSLRSGDPSQLVRQAQQFAREQPTLVAGMAMLAGFGIMRLIKNANAAGGTHSGGDDGSARKSP